MLAKIALAFICFIFPSLILVSSQSLGTPILGIDLGATKSIVAVWRRGSVATIPSDTGRRSTPSIVAFVGNDILVGDLAKDNLATYPENTVNLIKLILGRKFDSVRADAGNLLYKIVKDERPRAAGRAVVEVVVQAVQRLSAEEISAIILGRLRENAQKFLGQEVKHAVIAVPAFFTDTQRQATKDAGTIAGLNVLRIINAPNAAVLALGPWNTEQTILVVDFGGGSFDATLFVVDGDFIEAIATSGDTRLGRDFDNRMMQHFTELLQKEHGLNISSHQQALARLGHACEVARIQLSQALEATVRVSNIVHGFDFSATINRPMFEELMQDLFDRMRNSLEQLLLDGKLEAQAVDDIVLIGGSARMPQVPAMLCEIFGQKKLMRKQGIHLDEVVAHGAAIQGAVLSGSSDIDFYNLQVTPFSLGVETVGGVMTTLISRNTPLPAQGAQIFNVNPSWGLPSRIRVFEGEGPLTKDNNLLGMFELSDIPPAPRTSMYGIRVTFDVSDDGILTVTAEETFQNRTIGQITIRNEERQFLQAEAEHRAISAMSLQ